jgi:hypothetical protein
MVSQNNERDPQTIRFDDPTCGYQPKQTLQDPPGVGVERDTRHSVIQNVTPLRLSSNFRNQIY